MIRLAVLSGKGGTGKTTVSASLARVNPDSRYIDCDVEEPNGFLFLNPELAISQSVEVKVPHIDEEKCNLCGECARICQFNALAVTSKSVLIFPELCHSCGACSLVCKPKAITEISRSIGYIDTDQDMHFMQGRLNIGEPMGVPIIRMLRKLSAASGQETPLEIIDCSPGASCSVVNAMEGSDYALIVTEPSPFGLHDLKITVDLIRMMDIAAAVVINKSGENDRLIEDYCDSVNLKVLLKIPYSRVIAEQYARGTLPVEHDDGLRQSFLELTKKIQIEVQK